MIFFPARTKTIKMHLVAGVCALVLRGSGEMGGAGAVRQEDAAAGGGGEAHAAPLTSGDGGVGDEREGYEWVRAMCLG